MASKTEPADPPKRTMKSKNKQTKFPVARIKKIMQKDEEVGKVAQATPIVISKALELFLGLIIQESSNVTAQRGSKKVEAYHLKHAIETTEILDFLKEIVQAVPDPSAGGTISLDRGEGDSKKRARGKGKRSESEGGAAPAPRRRRKKAADVAAVASAMEDVKMEPERIEADGNGMDPDADDGGGTNTGTDDDEVGGRHRARMLEEDDGDYEEH